MTHVLMNTALLALLLILGAIGRNRANRQFGDKRAAGIRASRGIDVFAIVAALQLCESLAPPLMGSGVVGVIVIALEGAGIILGIGLLLSGIVRWNPQATGTNPTSAMRSRSTPGDALPSTDRDVLLEAASAGTAAGLLVAVAEFTGARQMCALALPDSPGEPFILDSLAMSPREISELRSVDFTLATREVAGALIVRTERIDGVRFVLYFTPGERAITEGRLSDIKDALQIFGLVCARETQRRRARDARALERFALATSELTAELIDGKIDGAPALTERVFTHLKTQLAPALAADVMIFDSFPHTVTGEAQLFSLVHRAGAPAAARGFYPLSQCLPSHTAEAPDATIVRHLPVFDSRPGWARLAQQGVREAVTGFLRSPDGTPSAQVTLGASRSGAFGERERKMLATALRLCAPLVSALAGAPDAAEQATNASDFADPWRSRSEHTVTDSAQHQGAVPQ